MAEARAAVAAGADVIVAQGAEAGGHRGAFNAAEAESRQVGLIVMGDGRHRGSTADHVVRKSSVPVLMVPSMAGRRKA